MRLFLALHALAAVAQAQISLTVNPDTSYSVQLNGKTWLSSAADAYVVSYSGAHHTVKDGSLKPDGTPAPITGSDILGAYTGYSVSFNQGLFVSSFRLYAGRSAVIFQQAFPKGLTRMNIAGSDDDVATGFPAFAQNNSTNLGFLSWSGGMCPGHTGLWNAAGAKGAALGSQSGPLVLFDKTGNAIALSPASDFMTAQLALANACGSALCAGHNGEVTSVPPGWTLETLLVGGSGISE
jgi:hypothetical protein